LWQRHGRTDDEIYEELETMFPYHGHPLSLYDFEESINTKKHDIAASAVKKMDIEVKQVSLAVTKDMTRRENVQN
jgi:hypothetical protein